MGALVGVWMLGGEHVIYLTLKGAACALERAAKDMYTRETLETMVTLFIEYKEWLRTHGPLGVRNQSQVFS